MAPVLTATTLPGGSCGRRAVRLADTGRLQARRPSLLTAAVAAVRAEEPRDVVCVAPMRHLGAGGAAAVMIG